MAKIRTTLQLQEVKALSNKVSLKGNSFYQFIFIDIGNNIFKATGYMPPNKANGLYANYSYLVDLFLFPRLALNLSSNDMRAGDPLAPEWLSEISVADIYPLNTNQVAAPVNAGGGSAVVNNGNIVSNPIPASAVPASAVAGTAVVNNQISQ